jgi:prepilin-type N-terminal cleavage/methylation domain-containing protein
MRNHSIATMSPGTTRPDARHRQRGFTLVEILAALMVLSFGATALLVAIGAGIATQREADLKVQASEIVSIIEADIRNRWFAGEQTGAVLQDQMKVPLPGRRGITYSVRFTRNPEFPDEYLAAIEINWLDAGEQRGERYVRLVHRREPFAERIRRMK